MPQPLLLFVCLLVTAASSFAQTHGQPATSTPRHTSLYLPASPVDFLGVVPAPPAEGSAAARKDLAAVSAAQAQRSAAGVRQAQQDDAKEDIFIYNTVLGSAFRAQDLPVTAALSLHVRNEAGTVTPMLKDHYRRPRPFVVHGEVHPVCEQKREPGYPSGHAMVGYLEALTLAQILPGRTAEILARADAYAQNRVVCGVHYPSDVAASRTAALVEFGALAGTPSFHDELAKARGEVLRVLGANAAQPIQNR